MVFHGYMVDWRRGLGQSVMQLMQCSGHPWIYGQLEEGGRIQSVMKIKWCNGLPEIHAQLTGGSIGHSSFPVKFNSFTFHALLHRWSFHITCQRPHNNNNNNNNNNIHINLHILFNIFVIISCLIIVVTV